MSTEELLKLRHLVWTAIRKGGEPLITSETRSALNSYRLPPFDQRALNILKCLFKNSRTVGAPVSVAMPLPGEEGIVPELSTIVGANTGIRNELTIYPTEVTFALDYLTRRNWIQPLTTYHKTVVTPEGVIELEKHEATISFSSQAFVAMWFNESTRQAWDQGFYPAIGAAGYSAFRIDQHHHENRIDDEIIAQIRRRFLVADFTSGKVGDTFIARGGVYYEAGFAQGLGLPVFWTVRQDCLDGLHFDTRQFPHLVWSNEHDLAKQLHDSIEARIGRGPL